MYPPYCLFDYFIIIYFCRKYLHYFLKNLQNIDFWKKPLYYPAIFVILMIGWVYIVDIVRRIKG